MSHDQPVTCPPMEWPLLQSTLFLATEALHGHAREVNRLPSHQTTAADLLYRADLIRTAIARYRESMAPGAAKQLDDRLIEVDRIAFRVMNRKRNPSP